VAGQARPNRVLTWGEPKVRSQPLTVGVGFEDGNIAHQELPRRDSAFPQRGARDLPESRL
jgi:hypothetical protein